MKHSLDMTLRQLDEDSGGKRSRATERINMMILNDYKQHSTFVREGPKHAFIAILFF